MKLIHISTLFLRLVSTLPQPAFGDSFGEKLDAVKTYVLFAFEGNAMTLHSFQKTDVQTWLWPMRPVAVSIRVGGSDFADLAHSRALG